MSVIAIFKGDENIPTQCLLKVPMIFFSFLTYKFTEPKIYQKSDAQTLHCEANRSDQ